MPKGVYDHSKNRHGSGWKITDTSKMCGHHPKSEFRKGFVPWNKGLTGVTTAWNKGKVGVMVAWNKGLYGLNSGESNPNWKGGYHKGAKALRRTKQWEGWRLNVFLRDDYTCKKCGAKSGSNFDGTIYLEAHHMIQVKDLYQNNMKKHIFNVDNGITVCRPCHLYITSLQRRTS